MKTIFVITSFILMAGQALHAQPIPADSLYLGQTPPGTTPVVFGLQVRPGSFDAERIAISTDGKEIYYTGIHGYYPTTGDTIRYYRYSANHWTGPFNLFGSFLAPALSPGNDTMYLQHNSTNYESFYSVRNGPDWGTPQRLLAGLNSSHYYQVTDNGNQYISSIPANTLGASDWCRLEENGNDTVAFSLGLPVSSGADNLDFFVSRDEDFMILAKSGLKISYHKTDGSWTNPKSLGDQINFGLGMWGPFVTTDDKYLFYTSGMLPDYSDTHVYWVRVDSLIDSLRYTNFIPYVKTKIPDQAVIKGVPFSFPIADTTFIDDDGNNTLVYQAMIVNGSPLPQWLAFDTVTGTFSGTPPVTETLFIRVTAIDTAGASAWTTFRIIVSAPASGGKTTGEASGIKIWPNPANGLIRITMTMGNELTARMEIINDQGMIIEADPFTGTAVVDLSRRPKGLYLARLSSGTTVITRRILLH